MNYLRYPRVIALRFKQHDDIKNPLHEHPVRHDFIRVTHYGFRAPSSRCVVVAFALPARDNALSATPHKA